MRWWKTLHLLEIYANGKMTLKKTYFHRDTADHPRYTKRGQEWKSFGDLRRQVQLFHINPRDSCNRTTGKCSCRRNPILFLTVWQKVEIY